MDSSNYRKRVLHKLARELELPKADVPGHPPHHCQSGENQGHPKDMQGLMRHSGLATTMEVYMQSLQKEVRTTINSIYYELMASVKARHFDPGTIRGRSRLTECSVICCMLFGWLDHPEWIPLII